MLSLIGNFLGWNSLADFLKDFDFSFRKMRFGCCRKFSGGGCFSQHSEAGSWEKYVTPPS
jgi:hypothetical protein